MLQWIDVEGQGILYT